MDGLGSLLGRKGGYQGLLEFMGVLVCAGSTLGILCTIVLRVI